MKYLLLIICCLVSPVISIGQTPAPESEKQPVSKSSKRNLLFLTLGYQIPHYGKDGKSFTDPLAGYSQETFLFALLRSTRVNRHLAFDIRLSYMRTAYWRRAMEKNFLNSEEDVYAITYPIDLKKKLNMISLMAGFSYRIDLGHHHVVLNTLAGAGNPANKGIGAEVKTMGTNALTTWKITKVIPLPGEDDLNKNLVFLFSAGAKYMYDTGKKWAVFVSADVISTKRTGKWKVEKSNQITNESAEYTVRLSERGFNITPGAGLVRHF